MDFCVTRPEFVSFPGSLTSSSHRIKESGGCVRSTSLPMRFGLLANVYAGFTLSLLCVFLEVYCTQFSEMKLLREHVKTENTLCGLCTYGENHIKCLANRLILRTSTTFAFSRLCSSQMKLDAGYYLTPQADNQRCCFSHKFQIRNKLLRCVLVRCELAEAGNPADSYTVSELKLSSKVRGMLFYAVTSLSAIILFIIMLGAHPFVLLLDRYRRKAHHLIAKIWATCTVSPFYKVHFEGLENLPKPHTPAVYVSNHQSFLDIYTLLTLGRSFKFISKTAIFLIPIIGWAMFLMGTIPLKRMDSKSQLDCLKRCITLVKNGASVFFFPEGTRSKDGKLGAFKKGAFSVAVKTGVPVVPITLEGTGKLMPTGMETILNPGSVRVVIHKPIEGNDAEALCNEARAIISTALDKDR